VDAEAPTTSCKTVTTTARPAGPVGGAKNTKAEVLLGSILKALSQLCVSLIFKPLT
jgi:hypothetical protein